ncbi:hypothetical protein EVAR_63937_1 [Eumeta japonica]|uniref:Uncharacterized protein n=1 Tax=Eumeta variegata TaxID=151549 RepID=A0A4C1ZMK1_EUMVA|nr:hypothetical protein EVAR_63937_1 [Eumeta japonica]
MISIAAIQVYLRVHSRIQHPMTPVNRERIPSGRPEYAECYRDLCNNVPLRSLMGVRVQYNARNSAAVKLVTKASQWREIGKRRKKKKGREAKPVYCIIRRQFRAAKFRTLCCTSNRSASRHKHTLNATQARQSHQRTLNSLSHWTPSEKNPLTGHTCKHTDSTRRPSGENT